MTSIVRDFGVAALAASLALVVAPASAHHSASAYDQGSPRTLQGTVREFRWTNPHTWIYLTVADGAGKEAEWRLEGTSLVVLARVGWRASTLKPGDRIEARIAPARNGDPEGVFSQVTLLATGQVLSGGLGPPGAGNVPAAPGRAGGPGYGAAPPGAPPTP